MIACGAIQQVAVKGTAKTMHRPFNDCGSFKQSLASVIFQRQIRGQPVGQGQRVSLQLPHLTTQNCGFSLDNPFSFAQSGCPLHNFAQSFSFQSIIWTARPVCVKPETHRFAGKLQSLTLYRSEKHQNKSINGNPWIQCCSASRCVSTPAE